MARSRVLIVETAGALLPRLSSVLGTTSDLLGAPVRPAEMARAVARLRPSLVVMEFDGLRGEVVQAVEDVMAEHPVPIVLFAADQAGVVAAAALVKAGALDVLVLPAPGDDAVLQELGRQLQLLAKVAVVHHPRGRKRATPLRMPAAPAGLSVVAVASSLGGPRALQVLLSALPRSFSPPIVICQHITPGFADDLARWLAAETGRPVVEASEGLPLTAGAVVVAPSSRHMRVSSLGVVHLDDRPPVGGFKPACDVLLTSVGDAWGSRAAGVVLTGMGRDGAQGLATIRARGGHTIAEAESSCVVFGMPKEAIALGAAEVVLPLPEIAAQLVRWAP